MKWGLYNLSSHSPSFDVMGFMQPALELGIEGVYIKNGIDPQIGYWGDRDSQEKRVQSIILPILKLYGVTVERGDNAEDREIVWGHSNDAHHCSWAYKSKKIFPLKPPQEALDRANDRFKGKKKITVSLRNSRGDKNRNSGPDWIAWANDHDAYVIPDYTDEELPLEDRLAMYELADWNLGVAAGHMSLVTYSSRPLLMFKWLVPGSKCQSVEYQARMGLSSGNNPPWFNEKQKLLWHDKDDYQTIDREFRDISKT